LIEPVQDAVAEVCQADQAGNSLVQVAGAGVIVTSQLLHQRMIGQEHAVDGFPERARDLQRVSSKSRVLGTILEVGKSDHGQDAWHQTGQDERIEQTGDWTRLG